MGPRAALSGHDLASPDDAAFLDRKETERAERLYPILHLLAECILFVLRNQSQRCVGRYAPIDKAVPLLDPDECDAVRTDKPVSSRNVSWIALKPPNWLRRHPCAYSLSGQLLPNAPREPRYGLKAAGSGSQ